MSTKYEKDLLMFIEDFKADLINYGTHCPLLPSCHYEGKRATLLGCKYSDYVPDFIKTYRTTDELWDFLKAQFYYNSDQIKEFYIQQFNPMLDKLESIIYSKENKLVELKGKFNSEYIKLSIDLMEQLKETNPTEAIGKAKELIESCCKTILDYFKIQYNSTDSISKLTKQVFKELKISPEDVDESDPLYTTLKQIYGNLSGVSAGLGELRNAYGSGHGKSDDYKGLDPRYSKLAVGCATTLVTFLWDCFEQQKSQK